MISLQFILSSPYNSSYNLCEILRVFPIEFIISLQLILPSHNYSSYHLSTVYRVLPPIISLHLTLSCPYSSFYHRTTIYLIISQIFIQYHLFKSQLIIFLKSILYPCPEIHLNISQKFTPTSYL